MTRDYKHIEELFGQGKLYVRLNTPKECIEKVTVISDASDDEESKSDEELVDVQNLGRSMWHHGPIFLYHQEASVNSTASQASKTAEDNPEVSPVVQALATHSA